MEMKKTVIIVGGGKGLRMGAELPKQFIPLQGKPILMHTIEVFHQWDASAELVLVIPEEHEAYWNMLRRELNFTVPYRTVFGGETRYHSVRNGLCEVEGNGLIAVHDGVRPFVTPEIITSCFRMAETYGAAIPVVPMIESMREYTGGGKSQAFDRRRLCIVQTPQVFHADLLRNAYEQPYEERFTEDASLVENLGHTIHLVEGSYDNIKITTPIDVQYAEIINAARN
jgi:2-C-methyl-D-erythritol 4-phosphate cytidylyltransferase